MMLFADRPIISPLRVDSWSAYASSEEELVSGFASDAAVLRAAYEALGDEFPGHWAACHSGRLFVDGELAGVNEMLRPRGTDFAHSPVTKLISRRPR